MVCGYLANLPAAGALAARAGAAVSTIPGAAGWLVSVALLGIYALIALPVGFKLGFIQVEVLKSRRTVAQILAGSFLMPGISEEFFFRVLLLPHPAENASLGAQWLWGCVSLTLFVVYHPLNIFAAGHDTIFRTPVFLLSAALLGVACTVAYLHTGSLWVPVVIHWIIVAVWLVLLGGYKKLYP
jgi:predicted Abi (CAAX) family protease